MYNRFMMVEESISALLPRYGAPDLLTRRVLIVDDEESNLDVLEGVLEEQYVVLRATSAPEALALLAQTPVDVIITDQRMPEMTGVDLLEQVRLTRPDIMGIVLTGYSDSPAILSAINRARVYRFLTKPWDKETVLSAVAQASDHVYHKRASRKLMELLVQRNCELETALNDLKATQQQLLHLERLGTMGRLATGIVHDLRNLMFGLMTLEEGLYIGEAPAEIRDMVRVGLAGVRNLVSSLDSLYAFSRSGQLSIERRPVSPQSVVADAVTVMRMNLDFRRRAVTQTVEPDLPPILADGSKLTQVLVNLIRNAVEATDKGQEIRIEARAGDGGGVLFVVEDSGCGVPAELADRLFEPFVSGKGDRGMGMGLYMARLVVEAHQGRIACLPRPGGGTRFEFRVGGEGTADPGTN